MPRPTILYTFATVLGATGIGDTAWHQISGLVRSGYRVTVYCGSCVRPVPGVERIVETLRPLGVRVPSRLIGVDRAMRLHDRRAARHLQADGCDLVYGWPSGSLATLGCARQMGIPSVLERPSAHTRDVYEIFADEMQRLGLQAPKGHYASTHSSRLRREEDEFAAADALLCPSDFVRKSFLDRGFDGATLPRTQYGFDPDVFSPAGRDDGSGRPFTMIYVGDCFPLKGLHYALKAWRRSDASREGRFIICGGFMDGYREFLAEDLAHPSVETPGYQSDVARLMRQADVLVLPSLAEGSALVTYEGRACGCVLLVSDAAGAMCTHGVDAFVHQRRDVDALTEQINRLYRDPELLAATRRASLDSIDALTWSAAADRLADVLRDISTVIPA